MHGGTFAQRPGTSFNELAELGVSLLRSVLHSKTSLLCAQSELRLSFLPELQEFIAVYRRSLGFCSCVLYSTASFHCSVHRGAVVFNRNRQDREQAGLKGILACPQINQQSLVFSTELCLLQKGRSANLLRLMPLQQPVCCIPAAACYSCYVTRKAMH